MNQTFQIGDFTFEICSRENLSIPDNFLLFQVEKKEPEYTYRIQVTEEFPQTEGKIVAKRPDLVVWKKEEKEGRLMGIKGAEGFYGCYQELFDHQANISLLAQNGTDWKIDTVFTSLFALERRMIERNSLILHCAYVEYREEAILFSAPSGTGKSTQADLWEKFRKSRTMNGDRALLRKIEGRWFACGWPVCGSSEICHAKDVPIHGIVVLRQGKENQIRRLSPVQAFTKLYSEITVNQWNRGFVQRAVEIIEDIISQIPVYELTCDMTEDAVKCLEEEIYTKSRKRY